MQNVTLIRPPIFIPKGAPSVRTISLPIGLAYIASSLQHSGFEVDVVDAIGESIGEKEMFEQDEFQCLGLELEDIISRINPNTDLIGITCMFSNDWFYSKALAKEIKKHFPKTPIILGGEHASASYEHCLKGPEIDIVVLGEGEETIQEVAKNIKEPEKLKEVEGIAFKNAQGEIETTPRRQRIKAINDLPLPAWECFPMEKYLSQSKTGTSSWEKKKVPMLLSRGCPYQCTFCTSANMWGTRYIVRDPDQVINEMKLWMRRYGIDHFEFYDLTAVVNKKWVNKFLDKLIDADLNITWSLPSGTRSEILTEEVLRKLKQSGCNQFAYAPESGSDRILKLTQKKINKKKMLQSMQACVKVDILSTANMIIGFPDEKHSDVWKTLGFILKMAWVGLKDLNLHVYSPHPGTKIYNELVKDYSDEELEKLWRHVFGCEYNSAISYSKHISTPAIRFYLFFLPAMFYTVQFVRRPWRFFALFRNVICQRPESLLEGLVYKYYSLLLKPRTD